MLENVETDSQTVVPGFPQAPDMKVSLYTQYVMWKWYDMYCVHVNRYVLYNTYRFESIFGLQQDWHILLLSSQTQLCGNGFFRWFNDFVYGLSDIGELSQLIKDNSLLQFYKKKKSPNVERRVFLLDSDNIWYVVVTRKFLNDKNISHYNVKLSRHVIVMSNSVIIPI